MHIEEHRAKIHNGGRVVIPSDFRHFLGMETGDEVIIRLEDNEIRVYSAKQAIKNARDVVSKYLKTKGKKTSLVDDFISERRKEAENE